MGCERFADERGYGAYALKTLYGLRHTQGCARSGINTGGERVYRQGRVVLGSTGPGGILPVPPPPGYTLPCTTSSRVHCTAGTAGPCGQQWRSRALGSMVARNIDKGDKSDKSDGVLSRFLEGSHPDVQDAPGKERTKIG